MGLLIPLTLLIMNSVHYDGDYDDEKCNTDVVLILLVVINEHG